MLGKWFQWAHTQEDYQEIPEFNQLVAQLWVEVLYNAIWSDDCMTFCERIIECISSNPATRAAIVDALKSDQEFNDYLAQEVYRLTQGQIGGKLLPGDCDNSVLAGRAIALVNRLDLNNQDFLEVMEVGTNDEERVADLIGAIPVAETFPVDEVFLIAQDFLEDFAENYNAASTEGRKDELARLIYCAMQETEDCSITFERLFTVFQEKALSGLTIASTVGDVVLFLGTGDFSNDDAIFYGLMAIQVAFVLASRDFYGIEIGTISGIMRDALPSSRWEEWEPCPEEWCFTIDLKATNGSASGVVIGAPEFPNSLWVSGEGVRSTEPLDRVVFGQNMPTTINLDEATIYWEYVPGEEFSDAGVWLGTNGSEGSRTAISAEQTSLTKTGLTSVDDLIFIIERSGFNEARLANFTRITLRGQGSNPFGSNNC